MKNRPMAKQLSVSVPDMVMADLEKEAKKQGRSLSNLAAYLIENGLRAINQNDN